MTTMAETHKPVEPVVVREGAAIMPRRVEREYPPTMSRRVITEYRAADGKLIHSSVDVLEGNGDTLAIRAPAAARDGLEADRDRVEALIRRLEPQLSLDDARDLERAMNDVEAAAWEDVASRIMAVLNCDTPAESTIIFLNNDRPVPPMAGPPKLPPPKPPVSLAEMKDRIIVRRLLWTSLVCVLAGMGVGGAIGAMAGAVGRRSWR